jgi:ferrous-iron efflux pump FieF
LSAAHTHHHVERGALTRRAAIASSAMAATLLGLKIWASWQTGSVSMLGSLADTALDIIASLATLYSVQLAAQPADEQHGFGHGKAEALAALFQTMLFVGSAIGIGWRGLLQLGNDHPPEHPELGIGVSLIAMAFTFALVRYQHQVVKKTGSVAIHADHVHYSSDLYLNAAVIVALSLSYWTGLKGADAVFGIGIAGWLLLQARDVSSRALDQLMDKEWPVERRDRFLAVAETHPELRGIHDMRTRTSGAHEFVQFHVWVDPDMTVREAHRVMDEIEASLAEHFPGVEILIHPDPEGHLEPHHDV